MQILKSKRNLSPVGPFWSSCFQFVLRFSLESAIIWWLNDLLHHLFTLLPSVTLQKGRVPGLSLKLSRLHSFFVAVVFLEGSSQKRFYCSVSAFIIICLNLYQSMTRWTGRSNQKTLRRFQSCCSEVLKNRSARMKSLVSHDDMGQWIFLFLSSNVDSYSYSSWCKYLSRTILIWT